VLKGERPLPADPQAVAAFIADYTMMGVERVWEAVKEISLAHQSAGLADPTVSGAPVHAMNALSKIDAPRCWRNDEKLRFYSLPYDLQLCVRKREEQRSRAVSRALQRIAEAKRNISS
jgi:hypothetical protein